MTTAARPTFDPARGGRGKGEGDLSALSKQYSSRDMPSHTKLKYRESGQGTSEDLKSRNFRRELEEKEHQARQKRDREKARSFTEAPVTSSSSSSKKPRLEQPPPASIDADDPVDDDDDDDDDDDSDDDDTAELLKELQKIRKERMEEQEQKERERKEEEERIRTENLLKGNPLLNQQKGGGNFQIKRRWDDDVVFKNCAKIEQKEKKNFINDTIRSEFHRKFMDKYIK